MKSKQMFILPMIIVAFLFLLTLAANSLHPTRYIKCDTNKLTVEKAHLEDGEAVIEKIKIPKGTKVKVHQKQEHSSIIIYNHDKLKVKNSNLANSFDEATHLDYVYCRRLVNLREEKGGKLSKVIVKKGEKVKVESIDQKTGIKTQAKCVGTKSKDRNKTYYLSGAYVESSKKLALKSMIKPYLIRHIGMITTKMDILKMPMHHKLTTSLSKKKIYKENLMPKHVKSVHVSMDNFINNQKYIEKLKNINTIIVETKNDEGSVLYASDVCKDYLSDPSQATNNAMISKKT